METKVAFSTRQVAILLGIRPSALNQAVWDTRVPAPAKGPRGTYQWTPDDIARAARVFHVKLPVQNVAGVDGQEVGK